MPRFNNCLSGGRGNGTGNGKGGYGMRLRDGSCQGQGQGQGQGLGQGNRMRQSASASGTGFFSRFLSGRNSTNSTSAASGIEELLSAITSLQQQIDELKNQSGK